MKAEQADSLKVHIKPSLQLLETKLVAFPKRFTKKHFVYVLTLCSTIEKQVT